MRPLFRIWPMLSAMMIALPMVAAAQTTAFDGTYIGVSIQGTGGRSCTPSAPAPRPLTIAGGNARLVIGISSSVFQGPIDPQGGLRLHSGHGALLTGQVDASGNASGQILLEHCAYQMTWRKR